MTDLQEANPSGTLYRILPFDRAVQILNGELHFASPDTWEDPYEKRIRGPTKAQLFGQCWSKRPVSDAMWRIYSPHQVGVRIATKRSLLRSALAEWVAEDPKRRAQLVSDVDYRRPGEVKPVLPVVRERVRVGDIQTLPNAAAALFEKRDAFEHEAECRAILWKSNPTADDTTKGLKVKLTDRAGFKLITSIYTDPRAADELSAAFLSYVKGLGFKGRTGKSSLYKELDPDPSPAFPEY